MSYLRKFIISYKLHKLSINMNYIILDLEATCWESKAKGPNEIIEIGAVCVSAQKEILGEYCSFVRPSVHPVLSDFCIKLTSITQSDVDKAPWFSEAQHKFLEWVLSFGNDYMLCSWGFYDKSQFAKDCERQGIDTAWLNHHISLKHQYPIIKGTNRAVGMKAALQLEGIELTGTHHRGIDDARNITRIFLKHFGKWSMK